MAEGLLRALPSQEAIKPTAQILMGDMRSRAEQWDAAMVHYQNALEDPPSGARYMTLMKMGRAASMAGNLDEALMAYEQASEISDRPDPFFQLGHVSYMQDQDAEKSLLYFEEAIKRDPNDYASLFRAAFMKATLGDMPGAAEYSRKSYKLFREDRRNVEFLSAVLAKLGQTEEALRLEREAIYLQQLEIEQANK